MSKIKASTLVETLVALVIITMVSAFFFAIILKAGNFEKNRIKITTHQLLLQLIDEAKSNNTFKTETFEYEQFYITKTVSSYKDIPGVYIINVETFTYSDKKIDQHQAIVETYLDETDE